MQSYNVIFHWTLKTLKSAPGHSVCLCIHVCGKLKDYRAFLFNRSDFHWTSGGFGSHIMEFLQ